MPVQLGVPELCVVIRDRIERSPHRRISFAEFMELALYHSEYGYYARSANQLGMEGDVATSAHLGPDFAELLAEQLVDLWQLLGQPIPFQVVEMGAGQGLIADWLLAYLQRQHPDCFAAVDYTLVEKSVALRGAQQTRLARWQAQSVPISWCELSDLPLDSVTGCFFSNELVDALPVHRVTLAAQDLQEQYVTVTGNEQQPFTMTSGPLSTLKLADYFNELDIALTQPAFLEGYTTEVNLAALDWLAQVAQRLHRGYVLTLDYGYTADRYYSPTRSRGTLQCYYRHAHHDDPLINIGQQDITAHVDFTTLERQGERYGLATLGNVPQELFLMALGLGDRPSQLAQLEGTDSQTVRYALQRREALHQLMNPMGLGKFNVLLQAKGLTNPSQQTPKGLTMPPLM